MYVCVRVEEREGKRERKRSGRSRGKRGSREEEDRQCVVSLDVKRSLKETLIPRAQTNTIRESDTVGPPARAALIGRGT